MKVKRIIPCLDIKDGQVVKGTHFVSLRQLGDPVSMAKAYSESGADELILLDISATNEARKNKLKLVEQVKQVISIPLTVGGGISSLTDITDALQAGADKVSINSAAVNQPDLINETVVKFGFPILTIAIDAKKVDGGWHVMTHGGKKDTGIDVIQWAKEVAKRGASEILLTSMDRDGVKSGYDLELTKVVVDAVNIPVIASGGVGSPKHFVEVFQQTNASAGLAASIFHEGIYTIKDVKQLCKESGVTIHET
ncbi:imidazole glycerol phosphate synthase subunit HisF [Amphibacillus sp. MSJ-3]|uniref:imidazole glycerol phosphate synthase subunit HisF n=1 Tax=Amphibacillus sp. MSJ-3 TaxID=2841505 RepID=UPI001C0EA4BA|nr:imidazole glycerol phosphate synthase subunit HisF [Amphibacillus sp. MSJ-3]MBU5594167.1 imidazole glycerol phosphate synthase subunit HisF [Amphibacillus sp. MSJ-3]